MQQKVAHYSVKGSAMFSGGKLVFSGGKHVISGGKRIIQRREVGCSVDGSTLCSRKKRII